MIKYDSLGLLKWYYKVLGGESKAIYDNSGNIYVTNNQQTIKLNKNGYEVWQKNIKGKAIAVDSKNNLWVSDDTLKVYKFSPLGNDLYVSQVPSISKRTEIVTVNLNIDEKDQVYITGYFLGKFVFKGDTITNESNYISTFDIFVSKMSNEGE